MGWFSRKREIEELRRQLAQLAQAIHHNHQPAGPDPSKILEVLLEGQVKQVDSFGGFIRMISDVAAERMGSALGRRGGRKRAATAERDARGRMLPGRKSSRAAGGCILCADPTAADFTTKEFEEHLGHKGRQRQIEAEPVRPTPEEAEVIEQPAPQPVGVYPLPNVIRPLSAEEQAGRASGDPEASDGDVAGHRNGIS